MWKRLGQNQSFVFEHGWWRKLKGWTTVIVTNQEANSSTHKSWQMLEFSVTKNIWISGRNHLMAPSLPAEQVLCTRYKIFPSLPRTHLPLLIIHPSTLHYDHITSKQHALLHSGSLQDVLILPKSSFLWHFFFGMLRFPYRILPVGWLENRNLFYHSSGSLKSKIKVPSEFVSGECSLLNLQKALSLCIFKWSFLWAHEKRKRSLIFLPLLVRKPVLPD